MPGISATSEEEDLGPMPGISAASEEWDPGSMPGISEATEEEGGGPGFHPRDLPQCYEGGGGRRIPVQDLGSTTRRSQWYRKRYDRLTG
jgi:hypothetical protein